MTRILEAAPEEATLICVQFERRGGFVRADVWNAGQSLGIPALRHATIPSHRSQYRLGVGEVRCAQPGLQTGSVFDNWAWFPDFDDAIRFWLAVQERLGAEQDLLVTYYGVGT